MSYFPVLDEEWKKYKQWLQLLKERGVDCGFWEKETLESLKKWNERIKSTVSEGIELPDEPSSLDKIKTLRPEGPRTLDMTLDDVQLEDKLLGAWLGRAAGCILGIPAEGMTKDDIKNACQCLNLDYPLSDFWQYDPKLRDPEQLHYYLTPRRIFLKPDLTHIGADDDLVYTIIGLLILEEYGENFTTEDVGKIWLRYLPMACTAEAIALENLKKGIPAEKAAVQDNPFCDWIGADIRSDPWGYAAAGRPEKAAEFAHRDAYISHRAAGIHGEMFFSAAISACFAVEDPVEALKIGLTEIPENCRMSQAVKQTLFWCEQDNDWNKTTNHILENFAGMNNVHAINNAAVTTAGIYYGGLDFEKVITLTVMAGLDTDCTGATAGSIIGAVLGAGNLPEKWVFPLGDRVETYLKGNPDFSSRDVVRRFAKLVRKISV